MLRNVVLSSKDRFAGTTSNFSIELDEHFVDSQTNYMMTLKWIYIEPGVIDGINAKCLKVIVNGLTYPFTFSKEAEKVIALVYSDQQPADAITIQKPILNHYYCNNKRIVRIPQNILNIKLIDSATNLPVVTLNEKHWAMEFTLVEV